METPGVPQVDLPCPGLHTCYYKKFFLLRMSVKVNGKPTQVTLNSRGYPVLQYYSEDEETGIDIKLNMSVVSRLVTHELVNYGVYHVDTYYYDNVPIFSVTFALKAQLEKFLRSNNTEVKVAIDRLLGEEFQKEYTEILKKTSKLSVNTDSTLHLNTEILKKTSKLLVNTDSTLHLITPCESNKPTVVRVTLANFSTLRCTWQQSELFTFRDIEALFSGTVELEEGQRYSMITAQFIIINLCIRKLFINYLALYIRCIQELDLYTCQSISISSNNFLCNTKKFAYNITYALH